MARQINPQGISGTHFYSRAGGLWKTSPSLHITGRCKAEPLIICYWTISGEYNLLTRRRSDFVFIYPLDLKGQEPKAICSDANWKVWKHTVLVIPIFCFHRNCTISTLWLDITSNLDYISGFKQFLCVSLSKYFNLKCLLNLVFRVLHSVGFPLQSMYYIPMTFKIRQSDPWEGEGTNPTFCTPVRENEKVFWVFRRYLNTQISLGRGTIKSEIWK
jgi:hypothetical protein